MGMALSRLSKIKDDDGNNITEYTYDELSRRTLVTLGNDANAVYEYDLGNRLTKLTNNLDDTNSIVFDYANYDKVGNRLSMKIDDSNAHVYTYDKLYQLTAVDYNDGNSTTYYYDSLGNRTRVTGGGTTTYARNCLNQYTCVDSNSFSYDKNGNLTDDGTYEYYYDCENRLIDVNENGSAVASYKYDFAGRRVRKIVDGNTTKYCYDGAQVIAEYENDVLVRKFVYGPGIDEPVVMIVVNGQNETKYYYHFDGLGSVAAISDNGGQMTEQYEYDVFGGTTIKDASDNVLTESAIGNPYGFTGRRLDTETDNYYYRARYYSPEIGRFLQTDPLGYVDGVNLYTYVGNNPVNLTDPMGLIPPVPGPWTRPYPVPLPKPKPPLWHRDRNRYNICPRNEPEDGQVDECGDNPNPWRRERWNPFHRGQQCYRRGDPSGPGGSQCCYRNGRLVGGSYDIWQPAIHWYAPWNWPSSIRHSAVDIAPSLIWYGSSEE